MGLDVVLDKPIMVKVDMTGERSVVVNVDAGPAGAGRSHRHYFCW